MSRVVIKQRPSYGGLTAYYTVTQDVFTKYAGDINILLLFCALEVRV